jgi:hypothetical protein
VVVVQSQADPCTSNWIADSSRRLHARRALLSAHHSYAFCADWALAIDVIEGSPVRVGALLYTETPHAPGVC